MSEIGRIGKNCFNRFRYSNVGVFVLPDGQSNTDFLCVNYGRIDSIFRKYPCDLCRSIALYAKTVNLSYRIGGFFVHKPFLFIFLILDIPERRYCAKVFSGISFRLKYALHIERNVAKPFVLGVLNKDCLLIFDTVAIAL